MKGGPARRRRTLRGGFLEPKIGEVVEVVLSMIESPPISIRRTLDTLFPYAPSDKGMRTMGKEEVGFV